MPKVTYVIPTLNSAKTLDATIYSLKCQRDVEVYIIVVDSGSTDETLEICQRWNVKSIYAEPGNMYHAINMGLKDATTKWLGYINSDDWLYPHSLSRLIALGDKECASVVYGNCDYTDGEGRFIYSFSAAKPEQLISLFKFRIFGFAQPSAIFTSNYYKEMNGFDEKYLLSADADFYLRGLKNNHKFSHLREKSISCFRIHQNQLSKTRKESMKLEKELICSPLGRPNFYDMYQLLKWRSGNSFQYFIRLLRQSTLSNQLKITKSMDI